jgi:hypothetical protein
MSLSAHVDHFIRKPAGEDSEANLNGADASCHSIKTMKIDLLLLKALPYVASGGRGVEFSANEAGVDRSALARV